ncbi:hypothetical protein GDO86_004673 [Hymenochirus boettgeri]|uniref:KRAB domain-containing protein n=1 Tax=Hymenochirus boettgeri TaxID=247094 RepID=A0A8T2K621_9PIPI|nr:hypothetical protein GDO86_004673 [Hymenochirus boettgeri]
MVDPCRRGQTAVTANKGFSQRNPSLKDCARVNELDAVSENMQSAKGSVLFSEIAVYFSEDEWRSLRNGEKDLYKDVIMDNYQMLHSLGNYLCSL